MKEQSDWELLEQVRRVGDVRAYGSLVERHQRRIHAMAYALLGNWTEAQDVTQEVFVRAYVGLGNLRDMGRFGAWLRRITVATCADWRRQGWPWPLVAPDVVGEMKTAGHVRLGGQTAASDPADTVSLAEEMDVVLQIIGELPARQRLPLVLHLVDGLSPQEVAQVLDIPRGTVRSLIHRGKAAILAELERCKRENVGMAENKQPEHELPTDFVYRVLSARSIKVVELALQEAFRRDHSYLGTEHILVGLAEEGQDAVTGQVLRKRRVTAARVRRAMDELLEPGPHVQQNATRAAPTLKDVAGTLSEAMPTGAVQSYEAALPKLLPAGAARAFEAALAKARKQGQSRLSPEHILSGMAEVECLAATIIQRLGVEPRELASALENTLGDWQAASRSPGSSQSSGRRACGPSCCRSSRACARMARPSHSGRRPRTSSTSARTLRDSPQHARTPAGSRAWRQDPAVSNAHRS
jgi:RNA polymerase sigma-70 factor (ECF subfamily)